MTRLDCPVCGRESSARPTGRPGPLAVCLVCRALFASGPTMTTVLGPAPGAWRSRRRRGATVGLSPWWLRCPGTANADGRQHTPWTRHAYLRDLISKGRESEELQSECDRLRHELEATQQRLSDQKEEHETEVAALKDEIESLQEERDDLLEAQDRAEDLKREVDRLENEKQTLIAQRKEHTDLVEYIEEERSIRERDAERRRKREQAGVLTRVKWWLVGRPAEDTADE